MNSKPMWFIVMLGGGRFSAAIFKGIIIKVLFVVFIRIDLYKCI